MSTVDVTVSPDQRSPATVRNYQALVPWLEGKAAKTYSQFGEDGLIAATLKRIGEKTRRCFEVGAGDGESLSNTKLLRDAGWAAVLVDSDSSPSYVEKLNAFASDRVRVLHDKVTPDNVNELFTGEFDFGVIDIDGQDYHVWEAMTCHPPVMLVEFEPSNEKEFVPNLGDGGQATLPPIRKLGESKGYDLIATTYCNGLFLDDR